MSVYAYQALSSLGLRDSRLLELLPSVEVLALSAGEVPAHGFGGSFWHVMDGLMCAASSSSPSDALDFYGPGSWFGEAQLMGATHIEGGGYECMTEVRLMRLPLDQTCEAFVHELQFSLFIARMALWRCQLRARMLSLVKAAKPAPRVALSLALLAQALGSSSSHLPSASVGDELLIPVKQAVLASHTGLSRAVLSLQLQPLVAAGWLRLDYGSLCLLKLPAWHALLQAHLQSGMHAMTMDELLTVMAAADKTRHQLQQSSRPT